MKATRSTRKVRKKKSEYMSVEAFVDLEKALKHARDFERGEGGNLKVTRIQSPRLPMNKNSAR